MSAAALETHWQTLAYGAVVFAAGYAVIKASLWPAPLTIPIWFRRNILLPIGVVFLASGVGLFLSTAFPTRRVNSGASIEETTNEQQVIEAEEALFNGLKNQDATALSKLLSDEFQFRDAGSELVSKADFLKTATLVEGAILSVTSDNMRVQIHGDTAVLSGTQKAVVRLKDGKQVTGEGIFTDVFVRRKGQWLLVFAHNIELPGSGSSPQAPPASQK